jgi:hypothetical protein
MATVTLTFSNDINVSLQAKPTNIETSSADNVDNAISDTGAWDIIYYVNSAGNIIKLGECIGINRDNKTIQVNVDDSTVRPVNGNYVFFGKDTQAGTSGVIGYYAEIEMKNESSSAAELFAVSTEYFVSSK